MVYSDDKRYEIQLSRHKRTNEACVRIEDEWCSTCTGQNIVHHFDTGDGDFPLNSYDKEIPLARFDIGFQHGIINVILRDGEYRQYSTASPDQSSQFSFR